MSRRASLATAAASYVQLGSTVVTGLITPPMALRFLDGDRVALWQFTTQSLGYFLLLDLGVAASVGRLMGEPLHKGDARECSRWYSLFTLVLSVQGLVMLAAGVLLVGPVIGWFDIGNSLVPEARKLWLFMLLLNALVFPLRVSSGILFAQNRYYWTTLSGAVGTWVGLLGFYFFLKGGAQSLAYGYSSALTMFFSWFAPWLAARSGPQRFRFSFREIQWGDLKEVVHYSSAVFVVGLAVRVVFFSQALVTTKVLGLSAVNPFSFSSRAGTLGLQIVWLAFDSLNPRWQQLYVAGEMEHLAASFKRYVGLAMSLAFSGGTLLIALNRPFVDHWTGTEFYVSPLFDVLMVLYILEHTWNHCLAFCCGVAKDVKRLAWVSSVDMVLNIVFSVVCARSMGVTGILAGGILGSLFTMVYLSFTAPRHFSLDVWKLIQPQLARWGAMALCAALAAVAIRHTGQTGQDAWVRVLFCLLASALFVFLHRNDLQEFLARFRKHRSGVEEKRAGDAG